MENQFCQVFGGPELPFEQVDGKSRNGAPVMTKRPSTGLRIPNPIDNGWSRPQTFPQKGKSGIQAAESAEHIHAQDLPGDCLRVLGSRNMPHLSEKVTHG
jgi:hypothetical protein